MKYSTVIPAILLMATTSAFSALQKTISIIPVPVSAQFTNHGPFTITAETTIGYSGKAKDKAEQLAGMLRPATGFALKVKPSLAKGQSIRLVLEETAGSIPPEGYVLSVAPDRIQITASSEAGLFSGCQSLLQLLPVEIYQKTSVKNIHWTVWAMDIRDYPRFGWRGAMLDVARYYLPKAFILKFIDTLAMHKMNSLQLHLTDDQGWRIEIKKYPKLTEVGAWRKESLVGHYRDRPHQFDGKKHGGFYTQEDIREIVAYARERHVNIVPEIEMPGHTQAAIASYPHLGNTKEKLPVHTLWGVNPNIVNANESTILFFQDVLTEVLELFPSPFIHIGGDEAPKKQWKASADAQSRIKALGLQDEHELQSYFIKRMDTFLAAKGRRLIGWDEILEGGLAPGATVMSWRGESGGIKAAQMGHDVVMAPTTYTYFDYYQSLEKDRPLAIGGFLPLEKVYGYDPVTKSLTKEQAQHILGTQGQIWTEYISTPQKAEYMGFPRLTALAEVAWTPREKKDYAGFIDRFKVHGKRFDFLGVNYHKHSLDIVNQ
ncbi:MAG: beta-N-acetylhexosaminidase [Phycisphaerae bacterium]|nr:beta-N-acetylhexosaminidase [Phycisphaerae bacterium]